MGNTPHTGCACAGPPGPSGKACLPGRCDAGGELQEQDPTVVTVEAEPAAGPAPVPASVPLEVPAQGGSYLQPEEVGRLVGDDICAICLEPLLGRAQTISLCGHVFHRSCLNRCGDALCPTCRQPIDEASATGMGPFSVGSMVTICGLQNHVELNGTRCRVVEVHEVSHRLEVRTTDSGRLYRVRPENLAIAESGDMVLSSASSGNSSNGGGATVDWDALQPGTSVQLSGLQTARSFNGRAAVVLSLDTARGRCEIRLDDGSIKTIRGENLRPLPAAAAPMTATTSAPATLEASAAPATPSPGVPRRRSL